MTIAAIDDEADIVELIGAAATGVGWTCLATTEPEAFLQAVEQGVDLIFLDLMMPKGDGIEMLRHLGARHCRAKIVLISGFDKRVLRVAEELAHSLGLASVGRLEKPFRIAQIEQILSQAEGPEDTVERRPSLSLTEAEVRRALDTDLVFSVFQPQVDLATGQTWGCEALARIRLPEYGVVSPDRFIPLSESSGLITPLTETMIRKSFAEFAQRAPSNWTLSINVSPYLLGDVTIPDKIDALARESGLDVQRIIVEVTETGLITDMSTALDVVSRLRIKGIRLSIDDYGTGYSSMGQLKLIPATELKIDRLFVKDMLTDSDSLAMITNTVELSHQLNLKVVAEGVETQEQERRLGELHCDLGQGYLYSRPVTLDQLLRLGPGRP